MADPDPEVILHVRIQDIVEKLHKLDCTLLGNKDDAWVMELLFKPGFHRYHLIEWILSKLGYDVGKISGPQNSAEERMKNLHSTVSDLGICQQNCRDVIKGTASMEEQLEFWGILLDIIWLKHEITKHTSITESDEGIALSPAKRKCINEEYEHVISAVREICETVNIKHLFEQEFQLLAPDVEREIKNMSPKSEPHKYPTLKNVTDLVKEVSPNPLEELCNKLSLNNLSVDESEDDAISGAKLNQSEEELRKVSDDLQNNAQKRFSISYNELRSLIFQISYEEFSDLGKYFNKLEPQLEGLSQLENSFPKLESSNSKLLEFNSKIEDLLNEDALEDTKYAKSLKLVKDGNL